MLCSDKTHCFHCLPSDPNIKKEWINCIFNEAPERVSKYAQVLSLLNIPTDYFTNKEQFDTGSSERLKLKDDAFQTILDPKVM